jgi:hypothetical protein
MTSNRPSDLPIVIGAVLAAFVLTFLLYGLFR